MCAATRCLLCRLRNPVKVPSFLFPPVASWPDDVSSAKLGTITEFFFCNRHLRHFLHRAGISCRPTRVYGYEITRSAISQSFSIVFFIKKNDAEVGRCGELPRPCSNVNEKKDPIDRQTLPPGGRIEKEERSL